jgi:hypothetical protein
MIIQLPVTTEVLEKIDDLNPSGRVENKQILIEFDTRKRDYRQLFGLPRKTKIGWSNERTFDVQELSSFPWPILYRITTADGYYKNESGDRVNFTPEITGLSTYRKVSDVTCRLAVYLYVIAGLSSRQVSKLMKLLFHVDVSKSSSDRWVEEVAKSLPSEDEIVRSMNQQLSITQGHFDEFFRSAARPAYWFSRMSTDVWLPLRRARNLTRSTSSPCWNESNGNQTMQVVNRIGGDLTTRLDPVEALNGLLYDDVERAASFTMSGQSSQWRALIGNGTPRTVPRYDAQIPAGRVGWMKFSSGSDIGLTGSVINLNPGGFNGGHNLHVLSNTDTTYITIPVYRP